MHKLNVILIDDELAALESLQIELEDAFPNIRILGTYKNPEIAVEEVKKLRPDLIFLDIGMPEMDGFEFLQQFETRPFEVIFITAYDEYAIRAFEFNAIAYILKPVLEDKLIQAVEKVVEQKNQGLSDVKLQALYNHMEGQREQSVATIALPIGEGYEFVPFDKISHVEADNNYSWVVLITGDKHLVSKTLKEMERMIKRPNFYRVHKSFLINLNHVKQYLRTDGGQVIMTAEDKIIPVSRRKKDTLKKALGI